MNLFEFMSNSPFLSAFIILIIAILIEQVIEHISKVLIKRKQ
jgi:hypothetical protein